MQTRAPALRAIRFSELSPQRQVLVRLCQRTNYGSIRDLEVRDRQPVFAPAPVVLMDLKLDSADQPRPETALAGCGHQVRKETGRFSHSGQRQGRRWKTGEEKDAC